MQTFLIWNGVFWLGVVTYLAIVQGFTVYKLRMKNTRPCKTCKSADEMVDLADKNMRALLGQHNKLMEEIDGVVKENMELRKKVKVLTGLHSSKDMVN